MKKYELSDDGGSRREIDVKGINAARKAAREWARNGDWDVSGTITVYIQELDDDGDEVGDQEWVEVEVGP